MIASRIHFQEGTPLFSFLWFSSPEGLSYGLLKIHKINNPFTVIVSSINTALYSFAKFLQKIIFDNLPTVVGHVNNSFELCRTLSGSKIDGNQVFISYDITSLFTNIPLDLAMKGLEKRWAYIDCSTKIPKSEFMMAVKFALLSTYFTFNNTIYK